MDGWSYFGIFRIEGGVALVAVLLLDHTGFDASQQPHREGERWWEFDHKTGYIWRIVVSLRSITPCSIANKAGSG